MCNNVVVTLTATVDNIPFTETLRIPIYRLEKVTTEAWTWTGAGSKSTKVTNESPVLLRHLPCLFSYEYERYVLKSTGTLVSGTETQDLELPTRNAHYGSTVSNTVKNGASIAFKTIQQGNFRVLQSEGSETPEIEVGNTADDFMEYQSPWADKDQITFVSISFKKVVTFQPYTTKSSVWRVNDYDLHNYVLRGVQNSTHDTVFDLSYGVVGERSTTFEDLMPRTLDLWFTPRDIATFQSDVPAIISVSEEGKLGLLHNSPEAITLRVSVCGSELSKADTWANLNPDQFDLDVRTVPHNAPVTVDSTNQKTSSEVYANSGVLFARVMQFQILSRAGGQHSQTSQPAKI